MKTIIPMLIFCFLISASRNEESQRVSNSFAGLFNEPDTTVFPLFIDDGTKIVYQVGNLTPDKGLKLYYDTVPYPAGGLYLPDSIKLQLSVQ